MTTPRNPFQVIPTNQRQTTLADIQRAGRATTPAGTAAPGAPPLGTAGSFMLNGQMVHVNARGIIDTRGPLYGKYPQAVSTATATRTGPFKGSGPEAVQSPPPNAGPVAPPVENPDLARQKDARARITSVLGEYGLESLGGFVWQQILGGKSDAEVLQDLRDTPEYKKRFPAMAERTKRGLAAISPGEYVAYERQARQIMRANGIPEGFYDSTDDFTNYLNGDVSIAELNDRVQLGKQAAFEAPPEVRQALMRDYGVSEGGLTAFFLDPDKAQPLLEKTYRAAQIGGASQRTGFGLTTRQENERLADLGVTAGQAQEGLSQLSEQRELFGALPGQTGQDVVTRDEQLGAAFEGNANARRRIEKKRRERGAVFEGGGGFASGQAGVVGLADTSTR